ncbi:MAG: hypothetical protein AB1816_17860 [Bacillota bacterium]
MSGEVVVRAASVWAVEQKAQAACERALLQVSSALGKVSGQVVVAAPYDPEDLLACFDLLSLRRGWRLAAYVAACALGTRGVCYACRGAPVEPDWLARQLESLSWAPWAGGAAPALPGRLDPRVRLYLEGKADAHAYWQASLFARYLAGLGCSSVGQGRSKRVRVVTSDPRASCPVKVPGWRPASWEDVAAAPGQWLPRVVIGRNVVRVCWHEYVWNCGYLEVVGFVESYTAGSLQPLSRSETVLMRTRAAAWRETEGS